MGSGAEMRNETILHEHTNERSSFAKIHGLQNWLFPRLDYDLAALFGSGLLGQTLLIGSPIKGRQPPNLERHTPCELTRILVLTIGHQQHGLPFFSSVD